MPFVKGPSRRQRRIKKLKKLLVIFALSSVGVVVAGAVGYHVYAGWRARDLAVKARENFVAGNYRAAWLQLSSARSLRENDPEVVRTGAFLETRFGRKESMALWDQLAQDVTLSDEDRLERSLSTLRYGTDEQFDRAIGEYEGAGDLAKAGALRTARRVIRGDLDGGIVEARKAAEATGDPFLRLDVAKLLRQRHASDFASPQQNTAPVKQEIIKIVDSLLETEAAEQALAFGLGNMALLPQETRQRWTARAMQGQAADNPALLPAADAMVRGQDTTAAKIYGQLRPLYDSAPLDRRASFALWLSSQGLAREALGLVTAQEAADNQAAFLVRADALGRDGNWAAVLAATDNAPALSESVRLMTRARAELAMGENDAGLRSVKSAILAATQEGRLANMVESADTLGPITGTAVNDGLFVLCGQTAPADSAFRLLRRRLGRTDGTAALVPAWQRAKGVAPDALSVRDFGRYQALFQGSLLSPEEAAAAVAENPADIDPRINQALLLIRRNRQAEAAAVFDRFGITFRDLPPGQQAVLAVAAWCAGDKNLAGSLRNNINLEVLTPGEKALLDQFGPQP
ncbi:MAG: hypothetical protein JHD33_11380 [Chthoniobacterales bacterium]|nr:hypothetical protein [Chthoniobacterales bacterium]